MADNFHVISDVKAARWSDQINVLAAPMPEGTKLVFGTHGAAYGLGALASARLAIKAALAGDVEAVVAAPQNETSVHAAGIEFDGYPSFVAKETGTDKNDVFLMLCFGERRIVHTTLHLSVADAIKLVTRERVGRAIRSADAALKRLGIASPKLIISGLNPHAGEGGLFGREELDIIIPAIEDAKAAGFGHHWTVRRRHDVSQEVRCFHRDAARSGTHHGEAAGAEPDRRSRHRHSDPVFLSRAWQRVRYRREKSGVASRDG